MDELKALLTVPELAERLKVTPNWVYSHVREKGEDRIPIVRVGKYIRFNEADVIAWLQGKQNAE